MNARSHTTATPAPAIPKSKRKVSSSKLDPLSLKIIEQYHQMLPAEQRAFSAACLAVRDGVDPTAEIIEAVGAEKAQPFLDIWQVFVKDAAEKAEAGK